MSSFINGFADELIKLGGDAVPPATQGVTRPIRQPKMKPIDPYKGAKPGMKPIDPYEGKTDRNALISIPRTAPMRGTAQRIRPSNAAGPTPKALTAVQPQTIKSWARPKRVRVDANRYVPVAAKKVEEPVRKSIPRKAKKRQEKGVKRLRLPGETASQFISRRAESRKSWQKEQGRQRFSANIESKMKQYGIPRGEALSRSPGTPEYEARAKRDAAKYHIRESIPKIKIKSSPTTHQNLKGYLLE